jgi:hypothetical protein
MLALANVDVHPTTTATPEEVAVVDSPVISR